LTKPEIRTRGHVAGWDERFLRLANSPNTTVDWHTLWWLVEANKSKNAKTCFPKPLAVRHIWGIGGLSVSFQEDVDDAQGIIYEKSNA